MAKSWQLGSTPADYNWVDVCWSADLELFVAVASSGGSGTDRVMTSPDGETWTLRTTPIAGAWIAVAWGADQGEFAITSATLSTGTTCILRSTDGITWTDDYGYVNASDVGGLMYAMGESSTRRMVYLRASTVGKPFSSTTSVKPAATTPTIFGGNANWSRGVDVGSDTSIIVGHTISGYTFGAFRRYVISTWGPWANRIDAYPTLLDVSGIAYSASLDLCVVSDIRATDTNGVATFPRPTADTAITATLRTTPVGKWTDVLWMTDDAKFIAVDGHTSGSSTYKAMESDDGITWTGVSAPDRQWQRMAYSPSLGIIVAVANSGTGDRVMIYAGEIVSGQMQEPGPLGAEAAFGDVTIAGFVSDATPLQAPVAMGAVPYIGRSACTSMLGALAALGRTDFTAEVEAKTYQYACDLLTPTGIVRVPISSWQATLQTTISSYAQVVIPAVTQWVDAVESATEFIVSRKGFAADGSELIEAAIVSAPVQTIRYDQGPYRHTCTLSGYSTGYAEDADPPEEYDRTLTGVRSVSISESSTRVRCEVDWLLRPSQRATFADEQIVASRISYYVNTSDAYMEVEGA